MAHPASSPEAIAALQQALGGRIEMYTQQLEAGVGRVVQAGPFKGMRLPNAASWTVADVPSKILGTYECETHEFLERAIKRKPSVIIDVGCAEGYLAVGLAMRVPGAKVYAFDINENAQRVCAEAASMNGVGDRVITAGECTSAELVRLAGGAQRALVILDCEGAELGLLDEPTVKALRHADILVECHDFLNPAITPTLEPRLAATHKVQNLREGPRDPAANPLLQTLGTLDRYLLVCEFRPVVMHWLAARPRQ